MGEDSPPDEQLPGEKLPLESLTLPREYRSLTSRFELMQGYDGSCAFVLTVDPDEFLSISGVGIGKLARLRAMQDQLPGWIEEYWARRSELAKTRAGRERASRPPALCAADRAVPFRHLTISFGADVVLAHLAELEGFDGSCGFIMAVDPMEFQEAWAVGAQKTSELIALQHAIPEAIKQLRADDRQIPDSEAMQGSGQLDGALCMELRDFFFSLSARERRLIHTRWRCGDERRTMKSLARDEGITESRMSRIASEIESGFVAQLSWPREAVWGAIEAVIDRALELEFPRLSVLFPDVAALCRMLERISGQTKGSIAAKQVLPRGTRYRRVLRSLLESCPAPIHPDLALDFVGAETGLSLLLCVRVIEAWEERGLVGLGHTGVTPGPAFDKQGE